MRQRVKVALADIRYVQTEIEKILNRTTTGKKTDNDLKMSNENSLKNSINKSSNFNTTPIKRQEISYRNTSPKGKKDDIVKVQTFAAAPHKGIFTIKQEKQQSKRPVSPVRATPAPFVTNGEETSHKNVMAMWKEKEKLGYLQTSNTFSKIPEDHSHKSIMDLWKERQRMNGAVKNTSKQSQKGDKTAVKGNKAHKKKSQKTPSPTKAPKQTQMKTPKMKKGQVEEVIVSGTITVPDKVDKPYYLQQKNLIKLRTDEDYLIKKYSYTDKQQQNLKEKYKVLDQRLQKLRKQFVPKRGCGPLQDEDEWQYKNKKKFALQSYIRYSPLGKLLKINVKLKREEQRSVSQQQRKRKKVVQEDSDKPKWID